MAKTDKAPEAPATEAKPDETKAPESPAQAAAPAVATLPAPAAVGPEPPPTEEDKRRAEQAAAKQRARARAESARGRYRVTMQDLSGEFDARDANEAWALFCDSQKTWPSRKYTPHTIEKIA